MQVNGEIPAPAALPWWKGSSRIGAFKIQSPDRCCVEAEQ